MNKRKVWLWIVGATALLGVLLLTGCSPRLRVGALLSESQSVELGDAESVRVKIKMDIGDLEVTGGAEELLEADFTYNVARLKPEVEFTDGTLVVQHPDVRGYRSLQDIRDFRNEWDLRLNNNVPMDLSLEMGAGTSDLQLAGLSLTGLDIRLGAGNSTVNLSGHWAHDLDVSIEAGAGDIKVLLPSDVGVRVNVTAGLGSIEAPGLTKDGNVYTNSAYGEADVTLLLDIEAAIGQVKLEVE